MAPRTDVLRHVLKYQSHGKFTDFVFSVGRVYDCGPVFSDLQCLHSAAPETAGIEFILNRELVLCERAKLPVGHYQG